MDVFTCSGEARKSTFRLRENCCTCRTYGLAFSFAITQIKDVSDFREDLLVAKCYWKHFFYTF